MNKNQKGLDDFDIENEFESRIEARFDKPYESQSKRLLFLQIFYKNLLPVLLVLNLHHLWSR